MLNRPPPSVSFNNTLISRPAVHAADVRTIWDVAPLDAQARAGAWGAWPCAPPGNAEMTQAYGEIRFLVKDYLGR